MAKSFHYENDRLDVFNGQLSNFKEVYFVKGLDNCCEPHFHKNIEIVYNLKGKKKIAINTNESVLAENQLAISNPYDIHEYLSVDQTSQQIILVVPNKCASSYIKFLEKNQPTTQFLSDESGMILTYFNLLVNAKNQLVFDGLLKCILGEIMQISTYTAKPAEKISSSLYQRIFKYIDDNYKTTITLDSISSHFGYNKYYFSKLFNKTFTISLNEYIAMVRLSKAEELIAEQNLSIAVAAEECGFGSVKTFYKYRKKVFDRKINN